MKMSKQLKQQWVDALRSGEYGQATGTLCDGKGNFCCLGVLEHIVLGGEVETYDHNDKFQEYKKDEYRRYPSEEFWEYAGITRYLLEKDEYLDEYLAELNDSGRPFRDLATIIEEQVEVY